MKKKASAVFAIVLAVGSSLSWMVNAQTPDSTKWTWCGWGGGGYFWSCAADPTNDNVFYLGGDVCGLFKSTDQCKKWEFINNGLSNYGVYCMEISHSNPQILYVMTTDGMCRTVDGGKSWTKLPETDKKKLDISAHRPRSVRPIAIDPNNPDLVYAGSKKGLMFKSIDGGKTWEKLDYHQVKTGKTQEQEKIDSGEIMVIGDFETNEGGWKTDTKYDSKLASAAKKSNKNACSGKGALEIDFACTDASWKETGRVQNHLGGKDLSKFKKLSSRLFVPAKSAKIQAQMVVQAGDKWLWQQGEFVDVLPGKWTEVTLDLTKLKDINDVKAMYVILRSPYSGFNGKVYLDSVIAQTSADEVINPAGLTGEKVGGIISSICISPKNPNLLFATSTDFPVLRSKDGGGSWEELKTPVNGSFVRTAPSDDNIVYAAFPDSGVMKSTDMGNTWTPASEGIDPAYGPREIVVHPTNPEVVMCIANKGWGGIFYRSDDGGKTWKGASQFLTDPIGNPTLPNEYKGTGETNAGHKKFSTLTNIAMSEKNPDNLLISANWSNVFSSDGGKTWREASNGSDITCTQDVCFLGNKVYAVAMDEGLLVSEDSGKTWKQLTPLKYNTEISGHQWRVAAMKKGDTEKIISTCSPWNASPNTNRILITEDGGKSFKVVTEGLPKYISNANCMWGRSYARALAVDPSNPDVIYLGIDGDPEKGKKDREGGGVFKSVDGGHTWKQLENQPGSRRMFFGLAVDPTDSKRIFWGCCGEGGGVYVSEDGGESWTKSGLPESWIFNVTVTPKGTVLAGGNNLWASYDHGKTWKKLTDQKGYTAVGIAFDPKDENRIWTSLVTWGENAVGNIQKTVDGGKTWQDITGDIPCNKPMVLRYNPDTRELWAAGVGIFRTKQ